MHSIDPHGRGVPFAAGDPCDKGIFLGPGELVDPFHIALAPIEDRLAGPVLQVIKVQLAQNSVDGFHRWFAGVGMASIEQLMLQFLFESASLIVISDYARLA